MTTEQRNGIFTKNQNLISITIRRNRRLIAALGLEHEDVAQELSIKMLNSIDKFDPERSNDMAAYLFCQLQFAILDMKRAQKPHGMTGVRYGAKSEYVYIDKASDNGTVIEIPSYDDASTVELAKFLSSLTVDEREMLKQKLIGFNSRKKRDITALSSIKEKFADYFANDVYSERRVCA